VVSRGVLLALAAYVFWGLSPLFWKLVDDVPALEVLAHRVLWSLPLLALAAWLNRGLRTLRGIGPREWALFGLGALFLSTNWGVFVWAVSSDRVVDASLGYYINPLVSVVLGVVFLGERLRRRQWAAVGLAAIGVVWLTVALGALPWVSLVLAGSFGMYGFLQKRHDAIGPWATLGAEVAFPFPIAVAAVVAWQSAGSGSFAGVDALWLVLAGPVTIVPLLLFGGAARRVPLSTIGVLQYVTPTMQLLLGVLAFGEPMPTERLLGFFLVWIAVAIYLWDLRRARVTA
jgi:chloramphenicol-sensitive protein RarD